MGSISQMAFEYRLSVEKMSVAIDKLRRQLKNTVDSDMRNALKIKLRALQDARRCMRRTADYLEHYYDRRFAYGNDEQFEDFELFLQGDRKSPVRRFQRLTATAEYTSATGAAGDRDGVDADAEKLFVYAPVGE